jgi:hypothetical protein
MVGVVVVAGEKGEHGVAGNGKVVGDRYRGADRDLIRCDRGDDLVERAHVGDCPPRDRR